MVAVPRLKLAVEDDGAGIDTDRVDAGMGIRNLRECAAEFGGIFELASNGIETTRRVRERAPAVRVIAFTVSMDEARMAGVLRAGAVGYVRKDANPRSCWPTSAPWLAVRLS